MPSFERRVGINKTLSGLLLTLGLLATLIGEQSGVNWVTWAGVCMIALLLIFPAILLLINPSYALLWMEWALFVMLSGRRRSRMHPPQPPEIRKWNDVHSWQKSLLIMLIVLSCVIGYGILRSTIIEDILQMIQANVP